MRPSRIPLPAPLRSTPVTASHRYYERSDSCAGGSSAPREHEHRPDPAQVSLRPVPCRHDHSVSTHQTCPGIAFTRYPSADTGSPPDRWVEISPVPGRLIAHVRPYRVRYPTDWSLPVDCSPPRLAATQLSLGTGRRAYTRRGLSPLCHGTIAGAPGDPGHRPAPGGSQDPENKQRLKLPLFVFRDLVALLLARSASRRNGTSSRVLTCLLRALGALCANLVVTSNVRRPNADHSRFPHDLLNDADKSR